jgi:MoaA/NifB/PqqE/SkfB family radical SAM enzyme
VALLKRHFPRLHEAAGLFYRSLRLYYWNRSARACFALLRHVGRAGSGRPAPRYITVGLTNRCECRCVHCYARGRTSKGRAELTAHEVKSVLDQAARLGVLQVTFSGGEPLLRDDVVGLVRYARDLGLITRISTNGLGLERRLVAELKRAGLTLCGVSIDDADPEVHDRLRNLPGAYARTVAGIKNLRRLGVPCEILTYARKDSAESGVRDVVALGRQLGVQAVYVFFSIATGAWHTAFDRVLTEHEKACVREWHGISFVHVEIPRPGSPCCVTQGSVIYVSPWGDVTPCPFIPFVVGNIRRQSLESLWSRYCEGFKPDLTGDCVMNDLQAREVLRRHAESVAASFEEMPSML